MIFAAVSQTFAQGNGLAGINEATSMVTSYFDPGTKLIYAIGAVVGLIGGIKVYGKFSSGDPDTSKTAASWFGACIFLIVSATILRSFFFLFMFEHSVCFPSVEDIAWMALGGKELHQSMLTVLVVQMEYSPY